MNLKDKKILFISVKLFSYEKHILNKLVQLGSIISYYDERPKNTLIVKALIRFKRNLYQCSINKYYHNILKEISIVKFDYFILLKGEVIPTFFLNELRLKNPKIISIYYTFDSFANNPNAIKILPFFEKKYTFDNFDAKKYGLHLRPLFFIDNYRIEEKNFRKKNIDLLFIGTAHSDRLTISNKINHFCKQNGLNYYENIYYHSRIFFILLRIFNKSFRVFSINQINFKPLTHDNIVSLFNDSNCILDINHPNQNGLTMRIFEALGAKRKIITTNKNIIQYPFYNNNNFCIIERDNPVIPLSFFTSSFTELDSNLYFKISLEGWIQEIFAENDYNYWDSNL